MAKNLATLCIEVLHYLSGINFSGFIREQEQNIYRLYLGNKWRTYGLFEYA